MTTRPTLDEPWHTHGYDVWAATSPARIATTLDPAIAELIATDHNEALARRWPEVRPHRPEPEPTQDQP